jgi:hypothetical protein
MRSIPIFSLLLFIALSSDAQSPRQNSIAAGRNPQEKALMELDRLAHQAHENGDVEKEIELRRNLSREAWVNYSQHPTDPGRWDRWAIVYENDLPLALLLEGKQEWSEAEEIYRRNQAALAHERLAGNDIKSVNQLHLAHLLESEGKEPEAKAICSHWKSRMRHIAAGQDTDHWHGEPRAPLYDTPELEVAAWDLACGNTEEGLKLVSEQIDAHPHMLASFTVLSRYYFANGEFEKALTTEKEGTTALLQK